MAKRRAKYVLRRADQVAALTSAVRCQIVDSLTVEGPSSVGQVAERLGRTPESLYYHFKALVEVGLVVQRSTRQAGRRQEAVYDVIASRLIADRKQGSRAYKDALARTGEAFLRLAAREHRAAVMDGTVPAHGPRQALSLRRHTARLTPEGLEKLNRRLNEVIELLDRCDDPNSETTFTVTIAVAPVGP